MKAAFLPFASWLIRANDLLVVLSVWCVLRTFAHGDEATEGKGAVDILVRVLEGKGAVDILVRVLYRLVGESVKTLDAPIVPC